MLDRRNFLNFSYILNKNLFIKDSSTSRTLKVLIAKTKSHIYQSLLTKDKKLQITQEQ